jgi:crotonobetainyl-CoA:carnitine CoA-transferase CaiB-like acyl-CoA transferase
MSDRALDGVRVVEFTDEIGAYCGKLLADLGADVIKVEPPGGGVMRHTPPYFRDRVGVDTGIKFWFQNTSKRSVVLDLDDPADRDTARTLALLANVIVEDCPAGYLADRGLGYSELSADKPSLVYTSVSGFGRTGPHAGWAYSDIVGQATGGVMTLSGEPTDPPNQIAGEQANMCASIHAAQGTMFALLHSEATGRGQWVDVSAQESLSMAQETAMQTWDFLKRNRTRTGERGMIPVALPGLGVYEAKDGFVYLGVLAPAGAELVDMVRWMGEEGMAEDLLEEPYATTITQLNMGFLTQVMGDPAKITGIFGQLGHIHEVIGRFIASRTAVDAYEGGQRRNLLFGIISTPEDLAQNAQLRARDWFQKLQPRGAGGPVEFPGPPYRLTATPAVLGPPPGLGEHTAEVLASAAGAR